MSERGLSGRPLSSWGLRAESRLRRGLRGAMKARREADIQREILRFLATCPGVVAWKNGTGSFRASYKGKERFIRMGKPGVSDIIGWEHQPHWQHGRWLAIEVKTGS